MLYSTTRWELVVLLQEIGLALFASSIELQISESDTRIPAILIKNLFNVPPPR